MKKLLLTIAVCLGLGVPVQAGNDNPVATLALGYLGGLACNSHVNYDVARAYMNGALHGEKQTPGRVADFVAAAVGTMAMYATINKSVDCPATMHLFGPNGSEIPGLLTEN